MRKSITALFLFSIVALVVVKAKLQLIKNVNSTRYYSKGCSAHRSKTKVVVLLQEIKKDTVADKMGELVLHKKDSCLVLRTSFMEGELQVELHLTETNTPQLIKNFFGTKLRVTNQANGQSVWSR
jgi:hypothetical protein